jgi:predicted outer membrane protein
MFRGAAVLLAALALALLGPAATAGATTPDSDRVSEQDKKFLKAAHQSNLAEIITGELAQEKGKSEGVRELGRLFVEHHTKLDADLREVAEELGVQLPDRPNREQRAFAAKLEKLSGSEFDKTWISGQIEQHLKAKANGEKEIAKGSNEKVIELAKAAAPIIKHHLHELYALSGDGHDKKAVHHDKADHDKKKSDDKKSHHDKSDHDKKKSDDKKSDHDKSEHDKSDHGHH